MNSTFDENYERFDDWYENNRFAYLTELEAARQIIPADGYGLEIGVGTGRFARPLGINIGIDPSKKMVEMARKRGVDARVGFGETLSFATDTFDFAVIIVTLCFVRDPRKVIAETFRVLKKNGSIIIGIIDKHSFLGKAYLDKKSVFYDSARFFGINEITRILEDCGFEEFFYTQTLFNPPEKIMSVEFPKEGHGDGAFVFIRANKNEKRSKEKRSASV